MKKGLLFILGMFGFLFMNAQQSTSALTLKSFPMKIASDENPLRCDSIVAKLPDGKSYDKIINEFDGNDNMISRTRFTLDNFTQVWTPDTRYEYEFDENKNITVQISLSWDRNSRTWIGSEKAVNTYNEQNKLLSMNSYVWSGKDWILSFQGRATYDERGNMLTNIVMMWDEESSKWLAITKEELAYNIRNQIIMDAFYAPIQGTDQFIPSFKTDYEFDENGNMTLRYMQDWNADLQQYTGTTRETFVVDEAGNETEYIFEMKDYDTGELNETSKREKSYDARGNMLEAFFYNKTEGNWIPYKKEEYTYNEKDSILSGIIYSKDFLTGELIYSSKNEYQYDASGNCTLNVNYYWDAANNTWASSTKKEWDYDTNGKLIAERRYSYTITDFDLMTGDWKETYKANYGYDVYGNKVSSVSYVYDMMQGFWYGQSKNESTYDEYGNILEEKTYLWLDSEEGFKHVSSIVYYYSVPTSITNREVPPAKILVRNGMIEVSCAEDVMTRVYDINGKLISQGRTLIPVQPGCYIVTVGNQVCKVTCSSAF